MHTCRKNEAIFVQIHDNLNPCGFCGLMAVTSVVVNFPYLINQGSHNHHINAILLTANA